MAKMSDIAQALINLSGVRHQSALRGIFLYLVGPPGIEPGLPAPKAGVLPVYYGPKKNTEVSLNYRIFTIESIYRLRSSMDRAGLF